MEGKNINLVMMDGNSASVDTVSGDGEARGVIAVITRVRYTVAALSIDVLTEAVALPMGGYAT